MSLKNYSITPATNQSGATPEFCPEGWALADINGWGSNVMAAVRSLAASDTIASATTCDLGTKEATFLTITNASGSPIAITGLGTVSAGIYKFATFNGVSAISLTHNGTSLILPGAVNKTTVAGDTALFLSLGSGNWKCMFYQAVTAATSYQPLNAGLTAIAALATTAFGRGILEYADAATAFAALKQAATDIATGVVELATPAEAITGTDTTRAVTAAGAAAALSANFTGTNQSKAASGYQKLPGGVIMQWGVSTVTTGTPLAVTLPVAFPTAVGSVTLTMQNPSGSNNVYYLTASSTTAFTISITGTAGTSTVYWMAVGY